MAELSATNIFLQQGQPFEEYVIFKVDGSAIDLQASTAEGFLADGRNTDTGGSTLKETFKGKIPDSSTGYAYYSFTGAEVEALESEVSWASDTELDKLLGYYYWVVNLIPTTQSVATGGVSQANKTFTVGADWTNFCKPGAILTISGSTGNDGNYTVLGIAVSGGSTTIYVEEAIPDATADGSAYSTFQVRVKHGECWYQRRTPNA